MIRRSKIPSGFSLIELLVVLSILGIVSAVGVSFVQSPVPAAVRASASSLGGAIREAQTLALSSGQQVYLQTTGGGTTSPKLSWGFRILNPDGTLNSLAPPKGSWVIANSEARYVAIGVAQAALTGAGTSPMPGSIGAISAHVLDNGTIWTREFFTGSSSATADADCPFFQSTGAINQEFAITIAGARSGHVMANKNRLELILVSPRSGITTYSKKESNLSTSPWGRS